jgi:hypothetical protein
MFLIDLKCVDLGRAMLYVVLGWTSDGGESQEPGGTPEPASGN